MQKKSEWNLSMLLTWMRFWRYSSISKAATTNAAMNHVLILWVVPMSNCYKNMVINDDDDGGDDDGGDDDDD